MKRSCARCVFWKRDGVDGICFYGPPRPRIVPKDRDYIVIWPRTQPDEFCSKCTTKDMDEKG